jgi:hypothetical protein
MINALWGIAFFFAGWFVCYMQMRDYDKKD